MALNRHLDRRTWLVGCRLPKDSDGGLLKMRMFPPLEIRGLHPVE